MVAQRYKYDISTEAFLLKKTSLHDEDHKNTTNAEVADAFTG